jgi:hypothetical protein
VTIKAKVWRRQGDHDSPWRVVDGVGDLLAWGGIGARTIEG